jgi:hypothetical protein
MAETYAWEAGPPGDGAAGQAAQGWPDWPLDRREAAQLARYVSVAYAAREVPTDLRTALGPGAKAGDRLERARQLYNALAARRIPYSVEPWNPASYDRCGQLALQRIRTPQETVEGPATCLDIVLTYAAMAIEAGLRPLVAIRYDIRPHALITVDLSWDGDSLADRGAVPGFRPRGAAEPGVWDGDEEAGGSLRALAGSPHWRLVDVVTVTQPAPDFVRASARGLADQQDLAGAAWTLVDVRRVLAALSERGVEPFGPPLGRSVPPIHGYLPAMPEFRDFASRQGETGELAQRIHGRREPATVVIHAPSGYGKSMLAHWLAVGADNGCGWFLNATDAKELRRSLAQAERGEHELAGERPRPGGEKADAVDDKAFAAAALDRLRATDRPWVVVVDNCDAPPDSPGLSDLLPRPHAPGQVVIITTRDQRWLDYASDAHGRVDLGPLRNQDLTDLGLPHGLADAVDGRPLIGLALAALRDRGGVVLPEVSRQGGPELVWDLLRHSLAAGDGALALARLLAWLPPEPMLERALARIAALDPPARGDLLRRLRLVTGAAPAAAHLEIDGAGGDSGSRYRTLYRDRQDAGAGDGLHMHRLFAAAVREQTWRDEPVAAAESVGRLLATDEGRWLFITAADSTALARLEAGDAERAATELADRGVPGQPAPGLLWYGLGHIRERRGPVRDSAPPFAAAVAALRVPDYSREVAEGQIGVARVTYQNGKAAVAELADARVQIERARELLAPLPDGAARQLREQGNALSWLIEQKLSGREPDLDRKAARYAEVDRNLWLSFAERLRIARGAGDQAPVDPDAVPRLGDGLGPERAFFNLAGVAIQLAKVHHGLAARAAAEAGQPLAVGAERAGQPLTASEALLNRVAIDLDRAEHVYQVVRELREQRYGGRPHPHLAACLHGLAIVGHYRAALLNQVGALAAAASNGAAAFDQRLRIAGSLIGPDARAAFNDPDVLKSTDLLLKVMTDAVLARDAEVATGTATVAKVTGEATTEWLNGLSRVPGPARTQAPDRVAAVREAPAASSPRYLSASYPDVERPRRKFPLEVSVSLTSGAGRSEVALPGLVVPSTGKTLLVSIYAPELVVHGHHQLELSVPADGDSAPARFELEALTTGVKRVRLRAWDGGSCVGELTAEVTIDEVARGRGDGFSRAELEGEPLRDEVTLEVTHYAANGENRYGFRFRDAGMRFPEVSRPLRYDPSVDAENLVRRINAIIGSDQPSDRKYRDLSLEGTDLWDRLVPEEVQRQFWDCRGSIKQLTILPDNDVFPWELLYPGQDVGFLVTGGFPVTRAVDRWRGARQLYKSPARFVVPRDPADVPLAAEAEAVALREILGATEPSISTLRELQDLIDDGGFGILHFACHGGYSDDDTGPQINLDRPFLPRELAGARATWQQPLVFLNACRSAGPRYRCFGHDGFAERFLHAGAGAFIGSLWEVADLSALSFATTLYQMLGKDNLTLGQAVSDLRLRAKDGDLTWLAYAVYGHPEARLV